MVAPQTPSASKADQKSASSEIVVALAVSTLIGAGGGGFLGFILGGETPAGSPVAVSSDKPAEAHAPAKPADTAVKGHGAHAAAYSSGKQGQSSKRLKELPPIVTNLAAPDTGWVRLQAAIVYDPEALPNLDVLVSEVTSDVVTFLRTLSLASIQGSDGLRRLHEDLTERAIIRSEGRIHEFIIHSLVVQ